MRWLQKELLLLAGNRALSAGDFGRARGLCERALAIAPRDAGLRLRLAVAEEELGNVGRAGELLEDAAQLEPLNPAVPVLRGIFCTMQQRFAEGLALLAPALERDPAQPLARAGRALALVGSGEPEAGLAVLREEIANTSEAFQAAVLCYTESAILEKAGAAVLVESILNPREDREVVPEPSGLERWASWLRRSIRLPAKKATSERETALRLLEQRRYPEAEAALAKLVESTLDDEAPTLLAYACLLGGKPQRARSQLKALEKRGRTGSDVSRLKGLVELLSGRVEDAVRTLGLGCTESTDFLDHHLLAVTHLARRDRRAARPAFLQALRFAPEGWAAQRVVAFSQLAFPDR